MDHLDDQPPPGCGAAGCCGWPPLADDFEAFADDFHIAADGIGGSADASAAGRALRCAAHRFARIGAILRSSDPTTPAGTTGPGGGAPPSRAGHRDFAGPRICWDTDEFGGVPPGP